jgi:membrane-bound lytic murein transglycosylase B
MGVRPALAKMRKPVLRMPKTPKLPAAVTNTASRIGDAAFHAADNLRILYTYDLVMEGYDAVAAAARSATSTVQQTLTRGAKSPAFGVAIIACLIYSSVDGAGAPPFPLTKSTLRDAAITQVAAVARASTDPTGPLVVAALHPKIGFHIAEAAASAPPPTLVVNTPGTLGIPTMALTAYRNAERMMATSDPGCGISWNLLAGIGRIESGHANGGATDARGTAVRPIYGPSLDGTLPGNEVVVQSSAAGRVSYARAMGPMQFLPGTWARYASDGDGDGTADPQNIFDATLAAARYLCSGGLNLRDQSQVLSSILRYNNSMPYAQNVLGWAAAYATGVVPVDLPPLTGPAPPLGDAHLEQGEGLGPNLPMNMHGLAATDPLARVPLIDLSGGNGQPWSALGPAAYGPSCTVICIGQQTPGLEQVNAPPVNGLTPPAAPPPFAPFAPPAAAPPVAPPPVAPPPVAPPPAAAPPVAPPPAAPAPVAPAPVPVPPAAAPPVAPAPAPAPPPAPPA